MSPGEPSLPGLGLGFTLLELDLCDCWDLGGSSGYGRVAVLCCVEVILGEGESLLVIRKGSTMGDSTGLVDEFKNSSSSLPVGFMARWKFGVFVQDSTLED